jgi:hypothetical protein
MNPQANTPRETMRHHLARLAEKLTASGVPAELVGDIAKPYLNVAVAEAPNQTERVLCQPTEADLWWYWWPWNQPIGSVDDIDLVMSRIVLVLRSLEAER